MDQSDIEPERLRRLTRTEYHRLGETGIWNGERVELLRGLVVRMSPPDPRHDETIERFQNRLIPGLQGRARVRIQSGFVASDDSEPLPNVFVFPLGDYAYELPSVALWLIEVANTSLSYDRNAKAEVYAEAGVPEYWIVNLNGRCIEVLDQPENGRYKRRRVFGAGEQLAPAAFPDLLLAVSELVPAPHR